MANETFANKKKKKSIETIQETKHTGKKKKIYVWPKHFPSDFWIQVLKRKKKNAVTYKCVFSKLVFTSKKEKSKQSHDHHRMAFEVINDFFLKQKEDHFAFWISI